MVCNACLNIFVLVKYPEFEQEQRSRAQSGIEDFLKANPAFANTVVSAGLQAGTEIIRSNPEIARRGAEALMASSVSANSRGASTEHNYAHV
jgi:hypothetical protein